MFTYLHVKNFKSLVNFTIDFRNHKNTPRKLNVIYGENGAGKSNLVDVFYFLQRSMNTQLSLANPKNIPIIQGQAQDFQEQYIKKLSELASLKTMISNVKTLNSSDNMVIECRIKIDKINYEYILHTDNENIVYEKLSYNKGKNDKILFEINKDEVTIKNSIKNNKYKDEIEHIIKQYWGKHSFLAIMNYEFHSKRLDFMEISITKELKTFTGYLFHFNILRPPNKYEIQEVKRSAMYLSTVIDKYYVSIDKETFLDATEKILNLFATSLYSDIQKVYYEKKLVDNNLLSYKLYIKKLIGDKVIDIEFIRESSGTQKLFSLIPFLIEAVYGNTVIIDEFDTGIHDLMVNGLLENINEHITGQLILTTQNTTLMESSINKDSIYILDILPNRNKEIYSLADYDMKLHPNLNIRKRYLAGLYGGIPYSIDLDFIEIDEIIKNAESNKK